MMNAADDENQLITQNFDAGLRLAEPSTTNNLISEAFNLNSSKTTSGATTASLGLGFSSLSSPFTVLPPSSNHFQPIVHSRTPSNVDAKDAASNLSSLDASPVGVGHKKSASESINASQLGNAASFFDQLGTAGANANRPPPPPPTTTTTTTSASILAPPPSNLDMASILRPPGMTSLTSPPSAIPTSNKLTSSLMSSPQPPPIGTTTTGFSILSPPSSMPPPIQQPSLLSTSKTVGPPSSMMPPPLSLSQPPMSGPPPPPTSTTTGSSSNPYSARGALNKKVYDSNLVPVAPIVSPPPPPIAAPVSNTIPLPQTDSVFMTPPQLFTPPPITQPISLMPMGGYVDQSSQFNMNASSAIPPQVQQIDNSSYVSVPYQQQQSISSQFGITSVSDQQNYSQSMNQSNDQNNSDQKTMWGWLKSGKFVNTFVEKAKYGVESIATIVDPQLKDYMHPANKQILLVSSISNAKLLHSIRESFNYAGFSKLIINAMDTQNSSQFAPQIIGFACALQSAKEKLENSLMQVNQPDCVCISFQDFVAELSTDCWFELAVIMLRDRSNGIDLTIYTDAVPVPSEHIAQLQQMTPSDYPFKYSGFSGRLPEKNFNFNANSSWLNFDTSETVVSHVRITSALRTLAFLFKNKLLSS